jgi:histidyl-tRNA synthetase
MLGGDPTPAVGFAAGMERLLLVLSKQGALELPSPELDLFVVALNKRAQEVALKTMEGLRLRGVRADMDFLARSLRAQMRMANRLGARFALIIGDDEVQRGKLVLRDMKGSQQEEMDLEEAVTGICRRLVRSRPAERIQGCE